MSRITIKRMLLDNQDNTDVLKKWAMIAKRGKDFFQSDEAKFFDCLYQRCFSSILQKHEKVQDYQINIALKFLDFLNLYLSSTQDSQLKQFMLYYLQDQQTIIRCRVSSIMENQQYKDALVKRCEELRHYINYLVAQEIDEDEKRENESNDENNDEVPITPKTPQQIRDLRFYKRLQLFTNICYKQFPEEFTKITSQMIGSIDQEENLREILMRFDEKELQIFFQTLKINFPQDLQSNKFTNEQIMIEILIEDLTKYQGLNISSDIAIFPTEEDIFMSGVNIKNPNFPQTQYLDIQDKLLRYFDQEIDDETISIRGIIESQLKQLRPLFGEETGDFIDFIGQGDKSAKILKISIIEVKAPKIGYLAPSEVTAEIQFSLSNHSTSSRQEWLNLKPNQPLFFICLDKSHEKLTEQSVDPLAKEYGIKLVRGSFTTLQHDQKHQVCKIQTDKETNKEIVSVIVKLDTIQYKNDIQKLMVQKSKFLEEIYSEAQLLIKIDRIIDMNKISNLEIIKTLYNDNLGKKQTEGWLKNFLIGAQNENDELKQHMLISPSELNIASQLQTQTILFEGKPGQGKTLLASKLIQTIHNQQQRTLLLSKTDQSLNQALQGVLKNGIRDKDIVILSKNKHLIPYNLNPKYRINELLSRRVQFLNQVKSLAESVNYNVFLEYTCERAKIFYDHYLLPLWTSYLEQSLTKEDSNQYLKTMFPFKRFIIEYLQLDNNDTNNTNDVDSMLFTDITCAKGRAQDYWMLIDMIFQDLEMILPFENLRNNKERQRYIVCSQTKVIGMTIDYARNSFKKLQKSGFRFDTLIVDDASLMSDIDIQIAIKCHQDQNELKKLILIGDETHSYFLPQSCFERALRQNYQTFKIKPEQDQQNLQKTTIKGMEKSRQIINVEDFKGKGMELNIKEGKDHIVTNLAEAEYSVALYMYLRLQSAIDNDKIVILTSESGQKQLIIDLLKQKCGWHPLLGFPREGVQTFDEFQGKNADIAIISLVYTYQTRDFIRKIDHNLYSWIISRGIQGNFTLQRDSLFRFLRDSTAAENRNGLLEIEQGEISSFIQLYKVDQKILELKESEQMLVDQK
ncbi:dead helicases superfamily protein [Stylonychia lemnae]|uniref:Dead helicases superfamily protein n=1 Tax=Stylonychia lemnae TaxID=5949 RepID=A0A078ADS6_STYLE|nr:dead helicases superfamily protein [Stylonychia lemnae]|eukprot:CDW79687.1 dead helicases superfamily protein [Stylonychia lemnae]